MLMEGIRYGKVDPFLRRIVSQDGAVRKDGRNLFTPDEILHMDWLCDNVISSISEFKALSAKAQQITRLQAWFE